MVKKIVIIGNAAGGKSKLSRKLGKLHQLPVTHVDSLQFLPGLALRPHQDTLKLLNEVLLQENWILDGYGPLDNLENRFQLADRIIFIDLPLWQHYWWLTKRQILNLWSRRSELPENCNELTWSHSKKMILTIWKTHRLMRPELLRILSRDSLKNKVIVIHNLREWNSLYQQGF